MRKTTVAFTKKRLRTVSAFLMLLVMAVPAISQVVHLLEGHEHEVCTISADHLHESKEDCGNLHFTPHNIHYNFISYPEHSQVTPSFAITVRVSALVLDSYTADNTQLRAPPVIA